MSRQLVTIDTSIDFPKEEAFFKLRPPEKALLKEFYITLGFNSLIKELEQSIIDESPEVKIEENLSYTLVDNDKSLKNCSVYFISKRWFVLMLRQQMFNLLKQNL